MSGNPVSTLHRALIAGNIRIVSGGAGGGLFRFPCPHHHGERDSVQASLGEDGRVLLHCHSKGCSAAEIAAAVGLTMADLHPTPSRTSKKSERRRVIVDGRELTLHPDKDAAIRAAGYGLAKSLEHGGVAFESNTTPAHVFDYFHASGEPAFSVCRWHVATAEGRRKELRQIRRVDAGGWCVCGPSANEPRPLYRLPELLNADPAMPVYICEGEKAADALRGAGFIATTSSGGSSKPGATDWTPLAGRGICILPDNDAAGEKYAAAVASILRALKPQPGVSIGRLRDDCPELPAKSDAVEWLEERSGESFQRLQQRLDSLPDITEEIIGAATDSADDAAAASGGDVREKEVFPEFEAGVDEQAATDFVVQALSRCPDIFAGDSALLQLFRNESGAYALHPLNKKESLRELVSARVRFIKMDSEGITKSYRQVPRFVPENLLARPEWRGVRRLRRIVSGPFVRPDGSLCRSPGYDAASETFADFEPAEWPAIPEQPTREDAMASLAKLEDVVAEFPWESETSRAAWLALVLALTIRPAIGGDCPAWIFDATTPGSGKSLLVDVATGIVAGVFTPKRSLPSDPAEQEKRLFSALLETPQPELICWDNLTCRIGGEAVESYVTAGGSWSSRILGASQNRHVSNAALLAFTGNGVLTTDDMVRRSLLIRLRPRVEAPEERRFRLHDIRAHVLIHRRELLTATLTLWAAYQAAGRPKAEHLAAWGGFQAFTDTVRGCVSWLGAADPFQSRAGLREQASKATALKDLRAAMGDAELTAQQLIDAAITDEGLREAVEGFCDCGLKDLTGQRLGKRLKAARGKIVSGAELTFKEGRSRAKYWHFLPITPAFGDSGDSGDSFSATRELEFEVYS
jgi:hypothetical protein